MKKQNIALIVVICLVSVVILSFILYNHWPFIVGKKIVLATNSVDSFDPFRGQYMAINYEISIISGVKEKFSKGDSVFVSLKKDEQGIWRKENVSKSKPDKGDFIKGKIIDVYENNMIVYKKGKIIDVYENNIIVVEYGIEQFFFERNANLPTTNITAEVAITNSGRARLIQLLHNGKPVKIEYEKFDIKS